MIGSPGLPQALSGCTSKGPHARVRGTARDGRGGHMGCSTRLAEMRFREVTGKTIREAIADIRMERAVVLLKGGATPIGDIAQACGNGTEAALRIAFRKRFGQSMRAWRNATA